jgi:amidase
MHRRKFLGAALAGAAGTAAASGTARRISVDRLPADLTELSATELSAVIHQRLASCEEVMIAYLARIHRYNPVYNALVSLQPDDACLGLARAADRALDRGEDWGWMHGMPHAVKDGTDVKGLPTSNGSPIFAGSVAAEDSLLTARMRSAGALFIGKTNLPEFGMGSQTYNPVFGATGSAWNPTLTAGGSSGGTASGLGTHMLPVGDGGDLMGSLRNPGAFNGVIGFRPTQGRVPGSGSGDLFYQQMGTSGPMGRNTEDTIRMLTTMAGVDPASPLSLRDGLPAAELFRALPVAGLRIGWLGDFEGYLATEPGVLALCETGLQRLAEAGAIVEPCQPDYDMARLWETWLTLRHWTRHAMRPLYDDPKTRHLLKPEAIWEIEGSFDTSADQIYQAGTARADWFRAVHTLFQNYDVLMLPTAQVFPFPKTIHWPECIGERTMDTYHRWMEVVIGGSLAGVPVANVPTGVDGDGRPMGMQVMGPFGEDQRVLEFALAYEEVTGFLDERPALVEPN